MFRGISLEGLGLVHLQKQITQFSKITKKQKNITISSAMQIGNDMPQQLKKNSIYLFWQMNS